MKKEDRDHGKPTTKNTQTGSPKKRQSRRAGESKATFTPPITGLRLTARWGAGDEFDIERFRQDTHTLHDAGGPELVRDLDGNLFFAFFVGDADARPKVYIYEAAFDAACRWLDEELRGTEPSGHKFLQFHGIQPAAHPGIRGIEYMDLEKAIYEAQGLLDLLTQKLYADFLFKRSEEGLVSHHADRAMNGCLNMATDVGDRLERGFEKLLDSITVRTGRAA